MNLILISISFGFAMLLVSEWECQNIIEGTSRGKIGAS